MSPTTTQVIVVPLQLEAIPEFLQETVAGMIEFLPRLVGALVILAIGWILGRAIGRVVMGLADRVRVDRAVLDTPIGDILGGTERAVSYSFGVLARWFVYALAILAAADVLAIPLLSEWIATAVTFLPAFIAGLLIIVLGFVLADFVGDMIMRTRAATETAYTAWFATGARLFLYFIVLVIGLDTMGVDVEILYVFARALAWGLGAALAIGLGIALGWGGKDYVSQNIDRWAGRASTTADEAREPDGGSGSRRSHETDTSGGREDTSDRHEDTPGGRDDTANRPGEGRSGRDEPGGDQG